MERMYTLYDFIEAEKKAEAEKAKAVTPVLEEEPVKKTLSTIHVARADETLASTILPGYRIMHTRRTPNEANMFGLIDRGDSAAIAKADVAALLSAGVRVISAHTADRFSNTVWFYDRGRGWWRSDAALVAEGGNR